MSKISVTRFGADDELWDSDRDTGVQVEKTADDDTVRIDAGGNTDVVKVTSTRVAFNDDMDDVDVAFNGDTASNVLLIDAGNNGVAMNALSSSWVRAGATISSKFVSVKPDINNWNSGAQGIYSNTALRGADFSLFRARGTESSPSAVQSGDVVGNIIIEGHDGTDFNIMGYINVIVDGTPAANDVRGQYRFLTWDGSTLGTALAIKSNRKVGAGGVTEPVSGFEVRGSLGRRVTTLNAATLTLDDTHDVIRVIRTSTGACTITLPSATSAWNSTDSIGRVYTITDASANAAVNNITINRAGTDTIVDTATGATSFVINTNGGSVDIIAISSTTWKIIGLYP